MGPNDRTGCMLGALSMLSNHPELLKSSTTLVIDAFLFITSTEIKTMTTNIDQVPLLMDEKILACNLLKCVHETALANGISDMQSFMSQLEGDPNRLALVESLQR
jgi:hypothetical protein